MKTADAGGAEAFGGCARIVLLWIAFQFVTSLTSGVAGSASATDPVLSARLAAAPMTKTKARAAIMRPPQPKRRVLSVMTHSYRIAISRRCRVTGARNEVAREGSCTGAVGGIRKTTNLCHASGGGTGHERSQGRARVRLRRTRRRRARAADARIARRACRARRRGVGAVPG